MKEEIKFIYNSKKLTDRRALGYVTALDKHVINEFDVAKNRLTETQLAQLANRLNEPIEKLIDTSHERYGSEIEGKELSEQDILTVITNDYSMLNTPIIQIGEQAYVMTSSYDTNRVDMAIEGVMMEHVRSNKE